MRLVIQIITPMIIAMCYILLSPTYPIVDNIFIIHMTVSIVLTTLILLAAYRGAISLSDAFIELLEKKNYTFVNVIAPALVGFVWYTAAALMTSNTIAGVLTIISYVLYFIILQISINNRRTK